MPRTPNNDSPNDMDNTNNGDDMTAVRGARSAQERDTEGRFAGNRQTRSRDEETGAGRGRGWFGDPRGHAQAGSRSHDTTRSASRSQAYNTQGYDRDDDRTDDNRHGRRNAEGQFAGGRDQSDDEADFGAWHAYGHNRGWHGYQRRGNADLSSNTSPDASQARNDQNRSGRGVGYDDVRSYAGRGQDYSRNTRDRDYDEGDDDRRMTSPGDDRSRDQEGRFTSHRH